MSERCAEASDRREEPLRATASRIERWLLVEQQGAWGPQAPPLTKLDAASTAHVTALARDLGARLLMIRRPVRASSPGRWAFLVTSTPGEERVLQRHVDEVLSLDLSEDAWESRQERLWLVCTQGRHDVCCALRGRPVATAMLAADPENVWETSHIGGDRFAANVVLLPEGHYFGRVTPEGAVALMTEVRGGRLDVSTWRGRSSLPLPVQAAQSFAREATGLFGLDDLSLVEQLPDGTDQWRVRLSGEVEVVVRYDREGPAEVLTCQALSPSVAPRFTLVELRS